MGLFDRDAQCRGSAAHSFTRENRTPNPHRFGEEEYLAAWPVRLGIVELVSGKHEIADDANLNPAQDVGSIRCRQH